tara:strand:+ start:431 stop:607 length:177 start_codon:yes stop_codon:yes gene_type:complete
MENQLSQKEIKSLIYIVANHYPCEKFDDDKSFASILFKKLSRMEEGKNEMEKKIEKQK